MSRKQEAAISSNSGATRRAFLGTTAAAVGAATMGIHRSAHAAENNTLKIGLIGCGGRGTGAAVQALNADPATPEWVLNMLHPDVKSAST